MGKPHDDFCGLLPINVYPQVKMGNNLLENLEEKRNRPRLEGSLSFNMRFSGMLEPPGLWRDLQRRDCVRGKVRPQERSMSSPSPVSG